MSSASDSQVMTITNHERIVAKIRVNTLNFICVRGHKLVCTSDRIPDLFCSFSNFDISKSFLLIFIRSKTSVCFVIKPPTLKISDATISTTTMMWELFLTSSRWAYIKVRESSLFSSWWWSTIRGISSSEIVIIAALSAGVHP